MKTGHGRASGKTRPQGAEERGLGWRACSLELEHSLQIETFALGKMSRLRASGGKQEENERSHSRRQVWKIL